MQPTIHRETPIDATATHALAAAAFLGAPHTSHTEQFIVDALRAAGALAVSLVARAEDGSPVGHVAVSLVAVSDGSPGWYGLGPISVNPACQGQGIGSALMQAALQALRDQGAAGCVLLGDPAYYTRFGFRPVPGLVLSGVPPENFMALSFGPALPRGNVTFHEAFGARS